MSTIGSALPSSPSLAADGTIYIGGNDGYLYALNADGSTKWSYPTGGPILSTPAIGADGTIYVGSSDHNLYALNPDSTLKWSFTSGYDITSSPVIGANGTIYFGSDDQSLYAVNPNGTQKWAFLTGGSIDSSPALATDGTVYVGSDDSTLYAVNPTDGSQQWAFTTGGQLFAASPVVATDGTIYITSYDDYLYAITPNGAQKWAFSVGRTLGPTPAIAANGTLYVGCDDGNVYAVSAIDGSQRWAFPTSGSVNASPIVGANGLIYVGSSDGNLYVINPDGTQKSAYASSGRVGLDRSMPAIGADGTLYVGGDSGSLLALGTSWTITPSAGPNGAISPNTPQTISSSATLTFTAIPDSGYRVDKWLLDGAVQQTGGNTCMLGNITADHTLTVTFKTAIYTVTPSAGAGGTITPNTAQAVAEGNAVTFTATPNPACAIDTWSVDGSAVQLGGTSFTLNTVADDHTVNVTFMAPTAVRKLPATYQPGTALTVSLTITPDPVVQSYAVQETPPAGWTVANISDGGLYTAALGQLRWGPFVDNSTRTLTYAVTPPAGTTGVKTFQGVASFNGFSQSITGDTTMTVTTYTITPSAGANGTISPNKTQTGAVGGAVTFTATPSAGYQIAGWTLDGNTVYISGKLANGPYLGTTCRVTFTADHTIAVAFTLKTYNVIPMMTNNGTVSPSTTQVVASGGSVPFTATPATGYTVDTWYVDGDAKQNGGISFTLSNVTNDHNVGVTFKQLGPFTVTPSADANATITPNTPQSVAFNGTVVFTGSAQPGYTITGWLFDGTLVQNGGVPYVGASLTITNVITDHTVKVTTGLTHPADVNNNWSIDIGELTAYGAAWIQNQAWPIAPAQIPIDYVTRAGFIWEVGEDYRFDATQAAPACWYSPYQADSAMPVYRATAGIRSTAAVSSAVRTVSPAATLTQPVTVTIAVTPNATATCYAVEELIPAGWTVTYISNTGSFDKVKGKVKWGPFFDNQIRTLSYTLTPPVSASGTATISGIASFNGANLTITGSNTIRISGTYQPDLLVCNYGEATYAGAGVINLDGTNQTKSQSIANGVLATYLLRVKNTGNSPDTFTLSATGGGAGWKVQYVDQSTGADITKTITATGWKTITLAAGAWLTYTIHVTPDSTVIGGTLNTLQITAVSGNDSTKKDLVKTVTTVMPAYQPDVAILNYGEQTYTGFSVLNADGTNQTKSQTTTAGTAIHYFFQVKNAGNTTDTFTLVCPLPAVSGWKVQFVDWTSGKDITASITAKGAVTAALKPNAMAGYTIHVTPTTAAASATPYPLLLTATSVSNNTKLDAVKAVTTKQ